MTRPKPPLREKEAWGQASEGSARKSVNGLAAAGSEQTVPGRHAICPDKISKFRQHSNVSALPWARGSISHTGRAEISERFRRARRRRSWSSTSILKTTRRGCHALRRYGRPCAFSRGGPRHRLSRLPRVATCVAVASITTPLSLGGRKISVSPSDPTPRSETRRF